MNSATNINNSTSETFSDLPSSKANRTPSKIEMGLLWFSRIFVGILFIISGWIKVNDALGFSYKLDEYFNVFQAHFGLPAAPFLATSVLLAALIAIFEVVLAFMLLLGYKRNFTAITLLAMIVFFTFLTGYSWITDSVKDCGCFGEALKLTPKQSFFKDLILLVFIGIIYYYRNYIKPIFNPQITRYAFGASALGTTALCAYCFFFLPIVDFRAACVGCDLKKVYDEGRLDYTPFGEVANIDDFTGARMLITMGHVEKLSSSDRDKIISVYDALKGTDVKVLAGSASLSDSLNKYKGTYPFPISSQDGILLKTMIRSNPGFILLKNGVIVENWSKYETPNREDILDKLK